MAHAQQTPTTPRRHGFWFGWIVFVGILLFAAGVVNVVQGLVAIFDDDFYVTTPAGLPLDLDYPAWGWALLFLGAALIASGIGVMVGATWARVVTIVLVSINALVNLGFAAAYPGLTILAVSFDVVAIYALVVHGGEARAARTGGR